MNKNKFKKKGWWQFLLPFAFFSIIWFFMFLFMNRQVNNAGEAIYFGTPSSAYWAFYIGALVFGLSTWGIYYSIKKAVRQKSYEEFKLDVRGVFRLSWLPILITLPFLYLGITNAIVISDEKINYDTYWSFQKEDYSWGQVTGIEIDYSTPIQSKPTRSSFNGRYILHFADERKIDLWQGTFGGEIESIKKIDAFMQKKNITFHVVQVPSEETIDKFFEKDADFISELYSR